MLIENEEKGKYKIVSINRRMSVGFLDLLFFSLCSLVLFFAIIYPLSSEKNIWHIHP